MHSAVIHLAKTGARLGCVAFVIALTGCATIEEWNPFSGKSKTKTPPAELVEFKSSMAVRTAWEASVGDGEKFIFSPAQAGDGIVVAAANGTIARLDAATGRAAWRINAGMRLSAGVGADEKTVVVAGEKGVILAFDANGKQRWKIQASSEVLSAPTVGADLVIVRSVDNRISAYDAETGVRKWIVQRTVPALTLRNSPGITIDKQVAYVALPGGRLIAVTLRSGAVLWEAAVGDPKGSTELERIADTSGAPVVIARDVCVVAYQGRVACFDTANGAQRWSKELSSDVGVAVDERFLFAADERGAVSALTRDGGVSVWRNSKLAYRRLSVPASFGRAVAVGDAQGYIHFLSREDGAFLARVRADKSAIIAAPVVAGANLVFQTQSGTVVALTTE
jgi:outer membrane protein assembly factor BamB